jgi:Peptidase family M1 domain
MHPSILCPHLPVLQDALFPHAESAYTLRMRPGVAFLALWLFVMPFSASAAEDSPKETYEALNSLRVSPVAVYAITAADRIELRRGDGHFTFDLGKLAFFAPFKGQITGAVFSGRGHVVAAPRDPVEKQQMARFLGAPVLDEAFSDVYLRFTDDTARELLRELNSAGVQPVQDTEFAVRWDPIAAQVNPGQSLRILFDMVSDHPEPYFYAAVEGNTSGPFDMMIDPQRSEAVLLGQPKRNGTIDYYDVWASYPLPGQSPARRRFSALDYEISTSILADTSLDAKADLRMRAETGGERAIGFQMARALTVDSVTGQQGERLTFFQNEGMNLQDRLSHGTDYLFVILPSPPEKGSEFTLHFRYRGRVIENAGNGVLFVDARESWYPHFGAAADFANYDLTIRWPKKLKLVATGIKRGETEDGDFRVGHWQSEKPVSVAGFNLGDYVSTSIASDAPSVDVYANRQLERSIDGQLGSHAIQAPRILTPLSPEGRTGTNGMAMSPPPPHPTDALKLLAREIEGSIRFYENLSGPFPFQKLSVSQIPGTFGQGWPGLLYLSTYSYLPAEAQLRAGLSVSGQEHFSELVPFHEVAHQWWGNIVGWDSYRDQWIDEAMANYLALLFADTQKHTDHSLRVWLARYRDNLVAKIPDTDQAFTDIGSLELGNRLNSSKSPLGFEQVIYSKGAWVMHMLHEELRQPNTKNPDERFNTLLHTLMTKYAYRALSTDDLQHEVEAVMTKSMDLEGGQSMEWFFDQWVRGTAIPSYRVEFSVRNTDKGFLVRGKLFQENVPHSFLAPVPLYAGSTAGHATYLGTVIASGPETSFHFISKTDPRKLVIDPQMTLLCVTQ